MRLRSHDRQLLSASTRHELLKILADNLSRPVTEQFCRRRIDCFDAAELIDRHNADRNFGEKSLVTDLAFDEQDGALKHRIGLRFLIRQVPHQQPNLLRFVPLVKL